MVDKKREDKRQTTPDTGVAVVPAPMSTGNTVNFKMREELRDALNSMGHPTDSKWKERRDFIAKHTPVDASQWTIQELEANRYSGYYVNNLKGTFEIWVMGRVAATERISRVKANPALIADMHERAFLTTGSIVDVDLPVKTEQEIKLEEAVERSIRAETETGRKA